MTTTDRLLDIIPAGVGTGDTITGVAEAIKAHKPSFGAMSLDSPLRVYPIKATNRPIYLVFQTRTAQNPPSQKQARRQGLLSGISSAAALCAAIRALKPKA